MRKPSRMKAVMFALLSALLADPFVGTGGTSGTGLVDDFPGASAPFGMVQWSPDTTSMPPSGGYFYHDTAITGFSLTHLSGAGCNVFGDFSLLPVLGEPQDPLHVSEPFTHESESAAPGYYSVHLSPGIDVAITAALRSGLASFTFPENAQATIVFNASADQNGVSAAHVTTRGNDEVDAWASSGSFCGMPNTYTVYAALRFDHPFTARVWNDGATHTGLILNFNTSQNRTVKAQAAVSYVDLDGARRNLATQRSWDLNTVRLQTQNAWETLLDRVRVQGGTADEQRMLYSSLYHALLSPTIFSDADGRYRGFDGRIHRDAAGHAEYSNFSGWDIYRTQAPLMALLAPHRVSDMMESLVHAAQQGGWLPKWPVANGYTGVMGGDPADAIIAGAYAFGARGFDTRAALRAMVKGASDTSSPPGQGWYYPRPGLNEYLRYGYVVNTHTTSVSPVPNAASETLEYALDDFSIAQFAKAIGDRPAAAAFLRRSQNWTKLFNTASGQITPRDADGAFLQTAITANGQSGFQEGNAAQYTWMVPQALGSLVDALGGSANTIARLDTFFSKLNAGQDQPYAWMGNEPSLASPWTYLYAGAPDKAQAVIRQTMLQLYAPTPDGIPGNDDLGTMSAWWVWNALGLYPINPSVPVLLLGAPLFTHAEIDSPSGRHIIIDAPQASDANMYVQSLRIDGRGVQRAWTQLPRRGVLHLQYDLGAEPNTRFGSLPQNAPPNYTLGILHFPAATSAALWPSHTPTIALAPANHATDAFAARVPAGSSPVALAWNVHAPARLWVAPSSGRLLASAAGTQSASFTITAAPLLPAGLYDVEIHAIAANGAILQHRTDVVRVAGVNQQLSLLYTANFSDDTVEPFDPRTFAYGNPVAVGSRPGDLAVSADGTRLYTANQGSNNVSVVDTNAEKTIATIAVGSIPAGIRITRDGKTLWVTNYGDGTMQAIDVATDAAQRAFAIGDHPEELALSPDGTRAYVALQGENALAIVDIRQDRVISKVPVGRHTLGVVLSSDGSRAYVSSDASDDVTVVDTNAERAIATIPVGKTPQGLALSPDGSLLLVANAGSNDVTPIDTRTLKALPNIPAGNGPFSVTFDRSGRYAFTADSGDGDCAIIDVRARKVLGRIPMGSFPIAVGGPQQ